MSIIVPTITTDDKATFDHNLAEFSKFTKRVHIDYSDGTFAPTRMLALSEIQPAENLEIDIHIMSAKPSDYLAEVLRIKPALCVVHAEVDDDVQGIFSQLKAAGIKVGVALLRGTFPKKVEERIALSDHVMIFAGQLGSQGGTIDMLQTEKVALIRALKSDLEISWDGGVNLSNVRALAHSDINVINVGSAITRASDPAAMYQSLVSESEKKGVLL